MRSLLSNLQVMNQKLYEEIRSLEELETQRTISRKGSDQAEIKRDAFERLEQGENKVEQKSTVDDKINTWKKELLKEGKECEPEIEGYLKASVMATGLLVPMVLSIHLDHMLLCYSVW